MKTKILLLLLLLASLAMDASSKQLETEATLREIQIRSTPRLYPRSTTMKSTTLTTKASEIAPTVFIVGEAIAVNFASSTSNASIVVTHADTGEVIHHELFSCSTPTTVLVDLQGCQTGLYYIDVATSSADHSGEFVL